jgi:TonB family protein
MLLLFGVANAQDAAPVAPPGKNPFTCRGDDSDTPGCTSAPRKIYAPGPKYPKKERRAHHQGTVVLWLVISPEGLPRDIKVSRTLSPEFDNAAIDPVKKWRFSPATRDGEPVAIAINVEVAFHLY